MENKHKIIIIALLIVIVALIAGLAMMLTGNDKDVNVKEGMQVYDFDSAFTMVVKDDAKFLKTWDHNSLYSNKIYYNEKEDYVITLSESDYFANNLDLFSSILDNEENYEHISDANLNIVKVLNKSEKTDIGISEKHFDYIVGVVEGNKIIELEGNDLDYLKEMANSIKFSEGVSK